MARKAEDTPGEERLAFTIPQVCAMVHISRAGIYRQMTAGKLASCKLGKSRRITATALRAWLESAVA